MPDSFFDRFNAKSSGITLFEHTISVVETGLKLIDVLYLTDSERKKLKEKFIIAAVLHDLGKIHPYFQSMLRKEPNVYIRHEIVSLWFALTYLKLDSDVLFAIATHHKGVSVLQYDNKRLSITYFTEFEYIYKNSDGLMNRTVLQRWLKCFSLSPAFKEKVEEEWIMDKSFIQLLRKQYQKKDTSVDERKSFSILRAILQAADHIASAGINTIPVYHSIAPENLFLGKEDKNFVLRHFQMKMLNWRRDVILHAPTGAGKTEAALCWVCANQQPNTHLIYILPYTASINAMERRLEKIFGKDGVIAQHSKTLDFLYDELLEEYSNFRIDYQKLEAQARKLNSLSREIYYPVKVMTLYQLLRVSLRGKGWEFSLLDLRNSLFIIDEFHTYNAWMTGLLLGTVKLFKKLFHAKFMFMSATIPLFMQNKIVNEVYSGDQSIVLSPDANYESDAVILNRKRHYLKCHNAKITSAIALIEDYLCKGRSVLVVVNNVSTCQELYDKISLANGKKKMLHGGFNQKTRSAIEKTICNSDKSKRPQLLIATQAVEVSLDINYDVGFIENAPIDALIQRLGRINRDGLLVNEFGEIVMAPILLFKVSEGKTPFYNNELLESTWEALSKFDGSNLSEIDLVGVCNEVYKEGYLKEEGKFKLGFDCVTSFEDSWIAADWEDSIDYVLKVNNQKIEILCHNLYDEYLELIKEGRYIEANRLLVSVYPYQLKETETREINNIKICVAKNLYYDSVKGCIEEK